MKTTKTTTSHTMEAKEEKSMEWRSMEYSCSRWLCSVISHFAPVLEDKMFGLVPMCVCVCIMLVYALVWAVGVCVLHFSPPCFVSLGFLPWTCDWRLAPSPSWSFTKSCFIQLADISRQCKSQPYIISFYAWLHRKRSLKHIMWVCSHL